MTRKLKPIRHSQQDLDIACGNLHRDTVRIDFAKAEKEVAWRVRF